MSKSKKITTTYELYSDKKDLPKQHRKLLKAAKKALKHSYSPYSKFRVSAALLLANGEVVTGTNQENAAYTMCLCAERVAIAAADAMYNGVPVTMIAITVKNALKEITEPGAPCGACRQVMCETEYKHKQDMEVILQGESGDILVFPSGKSLLPLSFDGGFLGEL